MNIVSINKFESLTDLKERVSRLEKKSGCLPDGIIFETKTAFNKYLLRFNDQVKVGCFYNYSFRGIPLILPWQIRI
jgi:hypothetical protein